MGNLRFHIQLYKNSIYENNFEGETLRQLGIIILPTYFYPSSYIICNVFIYWKIHLIQGMD